MRHPIIVSAVSGLIFSLAMPVYSAQGVTLDQRVKRLERMMENPVLLQLSRRLGDQQREIQSLQDENDKLKRELNKLRKLQDQRYTETDERLSKIEGVEPKSAAEVAGQTKVLEEMPAPAPIPEPVAAQPEPKAPALENSNTNDLQATALSNAEIEAVETQGMSDSKTVKTVEVEATEVELTQAAPMQSGPIKTKAATDIEKKEYKAAFALMRNSEYQASINAFEAIYTSYPNSDLASNATYWAGEGYLVLEKPQQALNAFMRVLNNYPDSPKVPDATLRAGDSYERLGQSAKAKELFSQVISSRPHSQAAKNARKRLDK